MSYYTDYRNKKILNRLKIIFVIFLMSFLFLHTAKANADELNPNSPIWMTIDGNRVQIPVSVAKKLVEEQQQKQTTEEVLAEKKIQITQHAKADDDNEDWILEAPGF